MRRDHNTVPSFPTISAEIIDEMTAKVTVNGVVSSVTGTDLNATRAEVIRLISLIARKLGRPVRALAAEDREEWILVVYPDGKVENDTTKNDNKIREKQQSLTQRDGNNKENREGPASNGESDIAPRTSEEDSRPSPTASPAASFDFIALLATIVPTAGATASIVITWLRQRRSDVRIKVTDKDGSSYEVDVKRILDPGGYTENFLDRLDLAKKIEIYGKPEEEKEKSEEMEVKWWQIWKKLKTWFH